MAKKKVIVSFDFEHDKQYYYLLKAWDSNSNFEFVIADFTPHEIQTWSIATIKQVLSRKIHSANYMIAIIGKYSNAQHPDYKQIGYRNWQAFEIAKNYDWGNKLVVVKINKNYIAPEEAYNVGAQWIYSFKEDEIVSALNKCMNER